MTIVIDTCKCLLCDKAVRCQLYVWCCCLHSLVSNLLIVLSNQLNTCSVLTSYFAGLSCKCDSACIVLIVSHCWANDVTFPLLCVCSCYQITRDLQKHHLSSLFRSAYERSERLLVDMYVSMSARRNEKLDSQHCLFYSPLAYLQLWLQ